MIGSGMVRPTQVTLQDKHTADVFLALRKVLELDHLNYMNAKTEVTNICHVWPQTLHFRHNINSADILRIVPLMFSTLFLARNAC